MYIRKEVKISNTTSYIDGKLKEYVDRKCTIRNITFTECEDCIEKLRDEHSNDQLHLLKSSLEVENELNKQTGLLQSIISVISSILLGMTVAVFTFFTANFQIVFNLFGKAILDSTPNESKEKTINEIQKMLSESVDIALNQVLGQLFLFLLICVMAIYYVLKWGHSRTSRKALFYHKLIERSIKLAETEQSSGKK
ncbi:hypothetical protein [Bacillus thuringiensis]|uniref:hypothetical protein n=1 Tax=Bacillus thuringiensis TaxID=1428 RepID=UPI000BED9CF9|nr:hypothetical protein [Bacillus thuringiensis]PDZ57809.1 hypothetical protein CON29_28135 [Bacillus thuringiensis]